MKIAYSGGSSSVFRKAFSAPGESMCTSSMIKTLYLPIVGGYLTRSMIALRSSTPLFEAASSSITSTNLPSFMALQFAHSPQGILAASSPAAASAFIQLSAFARILAVLVFPVPCVPAKRYAWLTVPDLI